MSEQFDQDLRDALREGPGKSLQGMQFTPAMRQNVLDRIRSEPTGVAPDRRAPKARSVPRPVLWAAVAAAAFVIALNLKGQIPGGLSRAAKSTQSEAPAAMKMEAAATPAAPAPVPSQTTSKSAQLAAPAGSETKSIVAAASTMAADSTVRMTHLTAPPGPERPHSAAQPAAPPASLTAPAEAPSLAANGSLAVTVQAGKARGWNDQGQLLWETPIEGVRLGAGAAAAPDGRTALIAGRRVVLLSPAGLVERSLEFPSEPTSVALAGDGRLAVALGATVEVYNGAARVFQVPGLPGARLAFGSDGRLAVLAREMAPRQLLLFGYAGAEVWRTQVTGSEVAAGPGGHLLSWGAGTVVAHRADTGAVAWQANPEGAGLRLLALQSGTAFVAVTGGLEDGGTALWVLNQSGEVRHSARLQSPPAGVAVLGSRILVLLSDGTLEFQQFQP